MELLDNLLERDLKARFLPLVEELPRAERLKQVAELYPAPTAAPEVLLKELTFDEAGWVRACAIWCLAESADDHEALAASTADSNPIVREIALVTLTQKAPARARSILADRLNDDSPLVRRQAELLSAPPT